MSTEQYSDSTTHNPQTGMPSSSTGNTAKQTDSTVDSMVDQAKQQGQHMADQAKQQGQQAAETIGQTASQGLDKAATAADGLADTLREKAPGLPGTTTDYAYQAANTLERGADYMREADVQRMRGDMEEMIRKYPVQSVAVGLAAGFVLARLFR